jgi:hypothetical protein
MLKARFHSKLSADEGFVSTPPPVEVVFKRWCMFERTPTSSASSRAISSRFNSSRRGGGGGMSSRRNSSRFVGGGGAISIAVIARASWLMSSRPRADSKRLVKGTCGISSLRSLFEGGSMLSAVDGRKGIRSEGTADAAEERGGEIVDADEVAVGRGGGVKSRRNSWLRISSSDGRDSKKS